MEETNCSNKDNNYISLIEAAKLCSYSEPYLRLRARQGKLKSIKLGKKWMTTAAWLDDYAARIQEWRELSDAKKNNPPVATLVSAPIELSGNLEQADISEGKPALASEPRAVFADNNGVDESPVAVFCDQPRPLAAPRSRRLVSFSAAGQIFPVPEQTKVDNVSSFSWFGALLSGAGCALALFLAVSWGDIPNILNIDKIGQANVRQAELLINAGQASEAVLPPENDSPNSIFQFQQDVSLKNLVDYIARLLDGG